MARLACRSDSPAVLRKQHRRTVHQGKLNYIFCLLSDPRMLSASWLRSHNKRIQFWHLKNEEWKIAVTGYRYGQRYGNNFHGCHFRIFLLRDSKSFPAVSNILPFLMTAQNSSNMFIIAFPVLVSLFYLITGALRNSVIFHVHIAHIGWIRKCCSQHGCREDFHNLRHASWLWVVRELCFSTISMSSKLMSFSLFFLFGATQLWCTPVSSVTFQPSFNVFTRALLAIIHRCWGFENSSAFTR